MWDFGRLKPLRHAALGRSKHRRFQGQFRRDTCLFQSLRVSDLMKILKCCWTISGKTTGACHSRMLFGLEA